VYRVPRIPSSSLTERCTWSSNSFDQSDKGFDRRICRRAGTKRSTSLCKVTPYSSPKDQRAPPLLLLAVKAACLPHRKLTVSTPSTFKFIHFPFLILWLATMYIFTIILLLLFSLSTVEASATQGYETLFFYEAYKIDFMVNGASRTLGLTCGKGSLGSFDTTKLATFNEFADCFLDRRIRRSRPRTFKPGPEGDTTTPDVNEVVPLIKDWGFVSQDPGKLVSA
jgi:hypothetical protein